MRYKNGHKDETRERILESAALLFNQKGYLGAGVDAVMKKVGLTAGGFYSHFRSKKTLLNEALKYSLESVKKDLFQAAEKDLGEDWVMAVAKRYLTAYHRDHVAEGCPMPALISDVSRGDKSTRKIVEDHLYSIIQEYRARVPSSTPELESRAFALMAMCVGGITLSRAVNDRLLSDKILESCLIHLQNVFNKESK